MGTYVYGIVPTGHPLRVDGVTGVGEPSSPLRLVPAGELTVVASDAPEGLRAKRRDLLAHETVLETLCAQGVTLPVAFGMVAENDSAVAEAVAARTDEYRGLLAELDGRVEVNVKARHHEEELLREILSGNEALRAENEQLREAEAEADQQRRIAFGERIAAEVQKRRETDAHQVLTQFRPFAVAESAGPEVDSWFVNTSFLVERDDLPKVESTADQLGASLGRLIELSVWAPLPPYSFTDLSAIDQRQG